ncbi:MULTISPECIES: hypothetical protein [unclassified Arthrobacter]|uniref:hypothetical protein n=1 Tax=unclassified Arthrobacter TaxID=235627 RepID=UPI0015E35334|nr:MULTISPECIES: hypothetical protein [unclassified Arthrobacter]
MRSPQRDPGQSALPSPTAPGTPPLGWTLEIIDSGTILTFEHAGFNLDTSMAQLALNGMGNGWPGLLALTGQVLVSVS